MATGIFILLGTPHEITVSAVAHLEGSTATVKVHFVLPYVQWGLKNPRFLIYESACIDRSATDEKRVRKD